MARWQPFLATTGRNSRRRPLRRAVREYRQRRHAGAPATTPGGKVNSIVTNLATDTDKGSSRSHAAAEFRGRLIVVRCDGQDFPEHGLASVVRFDGTTKEVPRAVIACSRSPEERRGGEREAARLARMPASWHC